MCINLALAPNHLHNWPFFPHILPLAPAARGHLANVRDMTGWCVVHLFVFTQVSALAQLKGVIQLHDMGNCFSGPVPQDDTYKVIFHPHIYAPMSRDLPFRNPPEIPFWEGTID